MFDLGECRFPSRRVPSLSRRGMVATSSALAAQAGVLTMARGGNAVDAALAAAIALTVVEPTGCGIGGDLLAMVWRDGELFGLNSTGWAPSGMSADFLSSRGLSSVPKHGALSVTVPGAPAGWFALWRRFGGLPFADLFEPAVALAEEGFPVSPVVSRLWGRAFELYASLRVEGSKAFFDVFFPEGRAPRPGEVFRLPLHARTLRALAESGCRDLYEGELAERTVSFLSSLGLPIALEDLEEFEPEEVRPISVPYRGFEVHELPPNCQGVVALLALSVLEGFDLGDDPLSHHRRIEALKLSFREAVGFVGDPRFLPSGVEELLEEGRIGRLRAELGSRASDVRVSRLSDFGTVYLASADGRTMVSLVQSNYTGFGSGLLVPGTGIALHNRGFGFSLDPKDPSSLAPRKRPYHTLMPGFLTRGGKPIGPFGVMGAYMQPQGHLQVISHVLDLGMNPQDAVSAPRWQWAGGLKLRVEPSFPEGLRRALEELGHRLEVQEDPSPFGRGQMIWRTEEGTLLGATDPRADGMASPF